MSEFDIKNMDIVNDIKSTMIGKNKKILDVGMFTGYSALKLASSIPENGEVHTFELAKNHIKTAKKFFDKSVYNNITIHEGTAIKNLELLKIGTFDFAFIDADKINYINYYNRCMMLIRNGGIIVLDNMLWSGKVLHPEDEDSIALNQAAEYINNDNRVFNHMVTIRDGLMICIKNE